MRKMLLLSAAVLFFAACSSDNTLGAQTNKKGKLYLRSMRWIATGYVELSWFYFSNDGWVVMNPQNGVDPVDIEKEKKTNPKNTGTYTKTADHIQVKWVEGSTTNYPAKFKGDDIAELDWGGYMMKQNGLPKGYKLNGTYSGTISFGQVSSSRTYTFNSDGTVTTVKSGVVSTGAGGGSSETTLTGKYSIQGNTLTFTYNDGTKESAPIGLIGSGADAMLIINTTYMKKV